MEIMEMAAELGKLVKQSEQYKKFAAADKAYDDDLDLLKLISEYNAQRELVEAEERKPEPDQAVIETVEKRIHELYNEITTNTVFINYNEAQNELNQLMQKVNEEITYQVTGQRPCTHDCSTCGGCH
nr:YlbF family regulator [Clostridia bacterium]